MLLEDASSKSGLNSVNEIFAKARPSSVGLAAGILPGGPMQQAEWIQGEQTPAADDVSRSDEHESVSEQAELDDAAVWYALESSPGGSSLLDSGESSEADPFLGFAHAAAVGGAFWGALLLIALL